jgi:hypothetical protein
MNEYYESILLQKTLNSEMVRRIALLILLLLVGQAGIANLESIYSQKMELTSESECNEEAEIQLPSSKKKKGNIIRPQQSSAISPSPIHKLSTYPIYQAVAVTQARHIIFCSLLL